MKFAIFIALIHLNLATKKKKRLSREMFAFLFYVQQQFTKLISQGSLALCEWYCMSSRSSYSNDCLHKTFGLINLNTENFTTLSHHIILGKRHKTVFFVNIFHFYCNKRFERHLCWLQNANAWQLFLYLIAICLYYNA